MVVVLVFFIYSLDVVGLLGLDVFQGLCYWIDFQNVCIDFNLDYEFQGDGCVDLEYGLLFGVVCLGSIVCVVWVIIDSGLFYMIVNLILYFCFMLCDGICYCIFGVDGCIGDDVDYFIVCQFCIGNLCICCYLILQVDLDIFYVVGWQDGLVIVIGMDIFVEVCVIIDCQIGQWDIDFVGSVF